MSVSDGCIFQIFFVFRFYTNVLEIRDSQNLAKLGLGEQLSLLAF